ncbi:MAG: hypothetical protein ACNS60_03005 [Candidatus Cyclobacteriaceae bacterium M2_1C_046]
MDIGVVGSKSRIASKYMLFGFAVFNVFSGIIFSFTNEELFKFFVTEDGYAEYLTAFFLLTLAVIAYKRGLNISNKKIRLFYFFIAGLFFFGFGEEISWGQRIIGFGTPEPLEEINGQNEFNLHNLNINEVNLNKVIFGTFLYSGVLTYFLLVPHLYKYNKKIQNLFKKLRIPIPHWSHGILYFLLFASLHIVDRRSWEIQELTFVTFVLIAFLFPDNKEDI